MYILEHRCAGNLSGGFGGPYTYVFSPPSTKPTNRVTKRTKKIIYKYLFKDINIEPVTRESWQIFMNIQSFKHVKNIEEKSRHKTGVIVL